MAFWQIPQFLAITIQISAFFSSQKHRNNIRGKGLKRTMSTFRIYHCYRSMFTLRRPSDIHKFKGQDLFADKYLIILVCAVHSLQKFTHFIHIPIHNELFSTEEVLPHPKENIHTNLSQLYELLEGSSNTLYLLQEFYKSCFIKSVTSCNYLNYILLVIYLCWGKFLNKLFLYVKKWLAI